MSEKTEAPTPRRLRKAQEEGDVPLSVALVQAIAFIVPLTLAPALAAAAMGRARARLEGAIASPDLESALGVALGDVVGLTLPLTAATATVAAAAALVQTGGVIAVRRVVPDLERLNPLTTLRGLFNSQRALSILRALLACLVVALLGWRTLVRHGSDLAALVGAPEHAGTLILAVTRELAWASALVGLALAGADVVVTRHGYRRRLRMTKDEVKHEQRESEGEPELKAARRRAHQEALQGAAIAAVRQATVLVVNPTHLATALRYVAEEDEAPRVLAHGRGELARHMIDAARAFGVPVIRDVPVARALQELEEGEEIPEALYEAVAEIVRDAWEQTRSERPEG